MSEYCGYDYRGDADDDDDESGATDDDESDG